MSSVGFPLGLKLPLESFPLDNQAAKPEVMMITLMS